MKSWQKKFFMKMMKSRSEMLDDPFMHVLGITKECHKPLWRYIDNLVKGGNYVIDEISKIKDSIKNSPITATRFLTYQLLNPELDIHPLYTPNTQIIPDYLRINFTRYRLSSHQLRVAVGRWSRTPRE